MLKFQGGPWNGKQDSMTAAGATLIAKWEDEVYKLYTHDGLPLESPDMESPQKGTRPK